MALFCINGSAECTGCTRCLDQMECSVCGIKMHSTSRFYELPMKLVCAGCSRRTTADKKEICSVCGRIIKRGSVLYTPADLCICNICEKTLRRN